MSGSGRRFTLPESASSGSLEVSVRGVPALNNLNDNDAGLPAPDSPPAYGYNRQPNNVNNDTLTDDLEIDVWEFKVAAKPVNGKAADVTMKINPTDGTPGFSFANSILYFNMPGWESNQGDSDWGAKTGHGSQRYSQLPVGMNYGGFTGGSFCYDSYGYSYGASMCTDTQTATSSAYFQFFSREGPLPISAMDQNMNYHNSVNASRLDCSTIQMRSGSSSDSSIYDTDINRIQSVAMEATTSGGNKPSDSAPTFVYMAYYDAMTKQVRFRWGTVGEKTDEIDGKRTHTGPEGNDVWRSSSHDNNAYGLSDVVDDVYTGASQFVKSDGDHRQHYIQDSFYKYSNTNNGGIPVQVVAASGVSGARSAYTAATAHRAGQYVALSIVGKDTANPIAVVSWYDSYNRELCMAYNENPTASNTWTTKVIDENGGINVKTVADADGGIHFAYYDNLKGSDLKYAYLPSYSSDSATIVTVDAYGAVGAKPTIDVVKKDGKWVPYIGYQSNAYLGTPAAAKMAYYVGGEAVATAGADGSDFYTGAWEVSVVPTLNNPNDDLINIGLWHGSNGEAQQFTNNSDWTTDDIKPNGYISNSTLNVCNPTLMHGNDTANPIVGYGIDTGEIEMAQKK